MMVKAPHARSRTLFVRNGWHEIRVLGLNIQLEKRRAGWNDGEIDLM